MTVVLDAATQIEWALQHLKQDNVVALPTETVYGLAGRALSPVVLAKIFKLKARPHFDPLIVHVLHAEQAERLVKNITPLHEKLMAAFWPGPLTLLFEKSALVPDLCTAGSPWVAVRAPAHPVFREILEKLKEPLAAPSANRFGSISPTSSQDVLKELGPYGLEFVVEGGRCERGIESTVVKITDEISILRPGAIAVEKIEKIVGRPVRLVTSATGESPGQLETHYAPRTKVFFIENPAQGLSLWEDKTVSKFGLLEVFPNPSWRALPWNEVRTLSGQSVDSEAAANLFHTLRDLDERNLEGIVALAAPSTGLGLAINDRLRRASVRTE